MTATGASDGSSPGTGPTRQRPFPFWVLQLSELVIALVLVDVSVHVRGGSVLVAAAVVFAGLAVTAQGPLGLVRVCPPRLHLVLTVTAGALAAAAPVVPALRPDIEGIVVLEFAAVGLIRVATLTRTPEYRGGVPGSGRRSHRRADRNVIDTTASVVVPGPPAGPTPGRSAGGPSTGTGDSAARRAGRAAGVAAAEGRRLAATHRPAAEAKVRQSLRQAGRWAGRLASRGADDPGSDG